jgi:hypothetical protein
VPYGLIDGSLCAGWKGNWMAGLEWVGICDFVLTWPDQVRCGIWISHYRCTGSLICHAEDIRKFLGAA